MFARPDRLRLEERRLRARTGAEAVLVELRRRGVRAELVGSLPDGRFDTTSDIDFLISECPRALKYALESVVEDLLPGLSFDVFYADELSPARVADMRRRANAHRTVG